MRLRDGVDREALDRDLVEQLETAERLGNVEFVITSGYRVGDSRCHGVGRAVDIACNRSAHRLTVVRALMNAGFTRIGLYSAHVHVDICELDHASSVLWLGGASK